VSENPETPKRLKPGTTRLAFIVICACLAILATLIVIYAAYAPVVDMKDMVNVALGAVVGILGTTIAFYFAGRTSYD